MMTVIGGKQASTVCTCTIIANNSSEYKQQATLPQGLEGQGYTATVAVSIA